MRVEWSCASMTSGGQCVITPGTAMMPLWSASSWDMHTLEVILLYYAQTTDHDGASFRLSQMVQHIAMPILVLAVDQSFLMMSSVLQVPTSYWGALAGQSCHTTASTLLMLVWDVKVSKFCFTHQVGSMFNILDHQLFTRDCKLTNNLCSKNQTSEVKAPVEHFS